MEFELRQLTIKPVMDGGGEVLGAGRPDLLQANPECRRLVVEMNCSSFDLT